MQFVRQVFDQCVHKHPYLSATAAGGVVGYQVLQWWNRHKNNKNNNLAIAPPPVQYAETFKDKCHLLPMIHPKQSKFVTDVEAQRYMMIRHLVTTQEYSFRKFLMNNFPTKVLKWGDDQVVLSHEDKCAVFDLLVLDLTADRHAEIKAEVLRKVFRRCTDEEWQEFVYDMNNLPVSSFCNTLWQRQPQEDFDLDDVCFWNGLDSKCTDQKHQAQPFNPEAFQILVRKFLNRQHAVQSDILGEIGDTELSECEHKLLNLLFDSLKSQLGASPTNTCQGPPKKPLNNKCAIFVLRFVLNKIFPRMDMALCYKYFLLQPETVFQVWV